ncbi:MAG: HAD hydrolase-like protein [Candidatus Paceibacterota bacterium]
MKKLAIFDFDGVFVHTLDMCYAINSKVNPHLSFEEYKKMSYGNFFQSFQGDAPSVVFTPSPTFYEEYADQLLNNFSVSKELNKMFFRLKREYTLCIVTSALEEIIKPFLKKEGLLELFSDVLGKEVHKSKVVKLKHLLEKYAVASENALYVTDTLGDIREAREAGIGSIGVTWGLHEYEVLIIGNPLSISESVKDLEQKINFFLC